MSSVSSDSSGGGGSLDAVLGSVMEQLVEPLDLLGLGELPTYQYLFAIAVVFVCTVWYRRNAAAEERRRLAQLEAERSKRVLERPCDPARVFTDESLRKYDGSNPLSPIYMSVKGIVFDVTSGEGFYGPGAGYAPLAGRESARALAKMETKEFGTNLADLGAYERQTLEDWFDRFDSKYPRVGVLAGYVDTLTGTKPPAPKPRAKANAKPAADATTAAAAADSSNTTAAETSGSSGDGKSAPATVTADGAAKPVPPIGAAAVAEKAEPAIASPPSSPAPSTDGAPKPSPSPSPASSGARKRNKPIIN